MVINTQHQSYLVIVLALLAFGWSLLLPVPTATGSQDSPGDNLNAIVQPAYTPLWGPYLTGTSASGTVINLKTQDNSSVTILYADAAYYHNYQTWNKKASDGVSGMLHHIPLNDLEVGTSYYYQVLCDGSATPVYSFSTFPTSGSFTFVVYGDNQDEPPNFSQAERHRLVAERIAAEEGVLFVLNTGDLVNDGDDPANWDRYFEAVRSMAARLPVYPARGNHDGDTLYYDIFGVPPYYSFDSGDAHFTVLDTIDDPPAQVEWLQSDLTVDKPWKFVVCHYPLYTSEANHFGGWENFREAWEPIFIANQVDAVWNGHIHAYERYLQKGVMYSVVATGGGPYDVLAAPRYEGHQFSQERTLGYTRVTVLPAKGTATAQFIPVAEVTVDGKEVALLPLGTMMDTYSLQSPPTSADPDPTQRDGLLVWLGRIIHGWLTRILQWMS